MDGEQLATNVGIGALVFLIMKFGDWAIAHRKGLRADTQSEWQVLWNTGLEQIKELREEVEAIRAKAEADAEASRARERECREDLSQLRQEHARASEHIRHIEGWLQQKNVKFRPYTPNPGESGRHPPTSPSPSAEEP